MKEKYWHLVKDKRFENCAEYQRPPWCDYKEALDYRIGCWRLIDGSITNSMQCIGCPHYKYKKQEVQDV